MVKRDAKRRGKSGTKRGSRNSRQRKMKGTSRR